MNEIVRLARFLRIDPATAQHAFRHRLIVGIVVAALILVLSLLW